MPNKKFSFNAARKLYENGTHPRVMLGPHDIDRLRRQIRTGDGRKIMSAIRRKVKPLVTNVLEADDLPLMLKGDGSHNSKGSLVMRGIVDIAFVGALDGDRPAIEALQRLFDVACSPGSEFGPSSLNMPYDLLQCELSEAQRAAFRRAALKQIRQVAKRDAAFYFKASASNMMLEASTVALEQALTILGDPGVPDLGPILKELIKRFEATLHTAINVDGYTEEDIGYGTLVTAHLAMVAEWLRRAGFYDAYQECPRFARFGRAMLHFVQPWGEDLSNTGDHGDDFGSREFVLARLAAETQNPTLLWMLGTLHYHHGKVHPANTLPEFYIEVPLRKGFRTHASFLSLLVLDELKGEVHPKRADVATQFLDRGRGLVSFRSGWKEDDTFVVFDGSQRNPSGQGHCHASCGHFSLTAVGEYFSIDTGRYNNEQSCHSVVLIDGQSGESTDGEWTQVKRHGNLIDYEPGEFCDFAAVDSSHQHNCFWARRYAGLVKGVGVRSYFWTVEDINKNNDWGEYLWQLQTCPENVVTTYKNSATIRGWRHGNLLDVHFAIPPKDAYLRPHTLTVEQDISTTSSYKYIRDIPAHVDRFERPAEMVHGPAYSRPRLLARIAGFNGRFMSIMIPRKKGEPKPKVTQLKTIDNAFAIQVTHSRVEDTVIFAYEHNLLEANRVEGRGQWCVVRRNRANGRLLAAQLGHGTKLKVDGKRIK